MTTTDPAPDAPDTLAELSRLLQREGIGLADFLARAWQDEPEPPPAPERRADADG